MPAPLRWQPAAPLLASGLGPTHDNMHPAVVMNRIKCARSLWGLEQVWSSCSHAFTLIHCSAALLKLATLSQTATGSGSAPSQQPFQHAQATVIHTPVNWSVANHVPAPNSRSVKRKLQLATGLSPGTDGRSQGSQETQPQQQQHSQQLQPVAELPANVNAGHQQDNQPLGQQQEQRRLQPPQQNQSQQQQQQQQVQLQQPQRPLQPPPPPQQQLQQWQQLYVAGALSGSAPLPTWTHQPSPSPLLGKLLAVLRPQLQLLDCCGLANTVQALGMLKHYDRDLMQELLRASGPKLPRFTLQQLGALMQGLGQLDCRPSAAWLRHFYSAVAMHVGGVAGPQPTATLPGPNRSQSRPSNPALSSQATTMPGIKQQPVSATDMGQSLPLAASQPSAAPSALHGPVLVRSIKPVTAATPVQPLVSPSHPLQATEAATSVPAVTNSVLHTVAAEVAVVGPGVTQSLSTNSGPSSALGPHGVSSVAGCILGLQRMGCCPPPDWIALLLQHTDPGRATPKELAGLVHALAKLQFAPAGAWCTKVLTASQNWPDSASLQLLSSGSDRSTSSGAGQGGVVPSAGATTGLLSERVLLFWGLSRLHVPLPPDWLVSCKAAVLLQLPSARPHELVMILHALTMQRTTNAAAAGAAAHGTASTMITTTAPTAHSGRLSLQGPAHGPVLRGLRLVRDTEEQPVRDTQEQHQRGRTRSTTAHWHQAGILRPFSASQRQVASQPRGGEDGTERQDGDMGQFSAIQELDSLLVEGVLMQVLRCGPGLRPRELLLVLLYCARLRLRPSHAWIMAVLPHLQHHLQVASALDLAHTAYSLARLQATPGSDFLRALQAASLDCIRTFSPQQLANLCWGLARLRATPSSAWIQSARRCMHDMRTRLLDIEVRQLRSALWHMAAAARLRVWVRSNKVYVCPRVSTRVKFRRQLLRAVPSGAATGVEGTTPKARRRKAPKLAPLPDPHKG